MKTKFIAFASLACLVIALACKKTSTPVQQGGTYSEVPTLPEFPDNYKQSTNDHLAALGRVLFYDKKLSLNNSVACANCHQQSKAFCDNKQFSIGLEDKLTSRNSPSIFAKNGRLFWDGRAKSISDLVLKPVTNHLEMKISDLEELAVKLSRISYYPDLFNKAYGKPDINVSGIQAALAEFVKNFTFSDNKFNRSVMEMEKLSGLEQLGQTVFFDKGRCSSCHNINDFGGGNGYGNTDEEHNIGLDETYSDNGIGAQTNNVADNGKFMVPALLNVEHTAPYMHDGRFKTLEEVVEHYNSGIKSHPNLDFNLMDFSSLENITQGQALIMFDKNNNGQIDESEMPSLPPVKLNLTADEKKGLVAFLKTLSDNSIFTDTKFSNPFYKAN